MAVQRGTAGAAVHTRHVMVALFLVTTFFARDDHIPIVSNAATVGAEVGHKTGTRSSIPPSEAFTSPACKRVIGDAALYFQVGQPMSIRHVEEKRAQMRNMARLEIERIYLNAWCESLRVGYVKIPKGDSKGSSASPVHTDRQHDALVRTHPCLKSPLLPVRLAAWGQESRAKSKTYARGR